MITRCLFVAAVLLFVTGPASAQTPFKHSKVRFEADAYSALEQALRRPDGNVFVFFYKEGHRGQQAADSLVLSDAKVSSVLNEKYERFAVRLDGEYAPRLLSWLRFRGVPDRPFMVMLNLKHRAAHVILSDWAADAGPAAAPLDAEQISAKLSHFADHGNTE